MKLPPLFQQIHTEAVFSAWMKAGRPPYVRIIPKEPLGSVSMPLSMRSMPDATFTIVSIRCWNDSGILKYEAASPADLVVAQEWSERHRETPPAAFTWIPDLSTSGQLPQTE